MTVVPWPDPALDHHPRRIATASFDMQIYWQPVIGQTAANMAHRFAYYLQTQPTVTFTYTELAATFGRGDNVAAIDDAFNTLYNTGIAKPAGPQHVELRLYVRELRKYELNKLPDYLAGPYLLTYADRTIDTDRRRQAQRG